MEYYINYIDNTGEDREVVGATLANVLSFLSEYENGDIKDLFIDARALEEEH